MALEPERHLVLQLAHNIPQAEHMGHEKILQRVLQWFYWTRVRSQVQRFFQVCPTCHLTQPKGPPGGGGINPLPIINTPFKQVGIDIVGPLPKASGGQTHILMLVDYATQ